MAITNFLIFLLYEINSKISQIEKMKDEMFITLFDTNEYVYVKLIIKIKPIFQLFR
jgi:hypothetical protein